LLSGGETAKIMPVQGGGKPGDPEVAPPPAPVASSSSALSPSLESIEEVNNENINNNNGASEISENVEGFNENNTDASELTNENDENGASEMSNEEETGENGASESNEDNENEENTESAKATEEEGTVSQEVPCPEPDSKNLEDLTDTFESSNDANDSKLTETIVLNAREFVLRKAKAKRPGSEEKDEVMADWKSLVFTEAEADFLNTLGLSPKLLFSSFYCLNKDWQEELVDFLYYLTVLTCYPARFVITKGECQRVREFLEIVESNLKAQQLRKLAEKPIPLVGPIVLSELGEDDDQNDNNKGDNSENSGSDTNSHANVLDRLKGLSVDDSKEKKSFTKKVRSFLSTLKFPSLFKKMKEEQENGNYPEEVNENQNVDDEGTIVNNEKNEGDVQGKTKEQIEQEYLEKLRELEIRKATEALPKEFQTETYRQYINRELRKHGFKEGNFANE
jgi:hypothetical protein